MTMRACITILVVAGLAAGLCGCDAPAGPAETAGAAERLETAARMQAEGRWSGLAQDLPRLRAALDIPAPNDFTPDGVRRSVAELANKSLSIEQATKILRADSRHLRETCRDDGAAERLTRRSGRCSGGVRRLPFA